MGILGNLYRNFQGDPVARAHRLRELRKLDRARELLQSYLGDHPEHLPSRLLLTGLCMEDGLPDEAVDILRKAFQQNPHGAQEIRLLVDRLAISKEDQWPIDLAEAEFRIRRGDLSGALQMIEALPANQRSRWRDRRLALIRKPLQEEGAKPLSARHLNAAYFVALSQESLGLQTEAAETYQTLLARNPQEKERVSRRMEALLATDYRNLELRLSLGEIHTAMGNEEKAVREFTLALELDPSAAPRVAARLQSLLGEATDNDGLRWILLQARATLGLGREVLEEVRLLTDKGAYVQDSLHLLERKLSGEFDPEAALLAARLHARNGRITDALEWIRRAARQVGEDRLARAYEEVIQHRPDAAQAYFLLSDLQLRKGNMAKAMETLRSLMEMDPANDSAILSKLTRFVEKDRNHLGALRILGELLLRKGEEAKAIVVLRNALRNCPEGDRHIRETFQEWLRKRPDLPRLRLAMAEALGAEKRFGEALREIAILAEKAPQLAAEFLHLLSLISLRSPELANASLGVYQTLEKSPQLPDAVQFGMAQAEAAAGHFRNSLARYRNISRKFPHRMKLVERAIHRLAETPPAAAEARYALSEIALSRGQFETASRVLRFAGLRNPAEFNRILGILIREVSRDPKNLPARVGLSGAYLVGRYFQRVLALGRETLAIRDDETTATVRIDIGDALREMGDLTGAVKTYYSAFQTRSDLAPRVIMTLRSILEVHPRMGLAHLALGRLLLHGGKVEEGIDALMEARRFDPETGRAVLGHLEQLCSLNPTAAFIPLSMASIYRETGDTRKAVQVLGELLDFSPQVAPKVVSGLQEIVDREEGNTQAWFELGRGLQILGKPDLAGEAYFRAFQGDERLGPRTLALLQRLVKEYPASAGVAATLSRILASQERWLEAAEWMQKAIQKSEEPDPSLLEELESIARNEPENPQMSLILATEFGRAGRAGDALDCYEKVLELDPDLHREVRICVSHFLEPGPHHSRAHLLRCRAWILEGRSREAFADLREASRLGAAREMVLAQGEELHRRFPGDLGPLLYLLDLRISGSEFVEAAGLLDGADASVWEKGEKLALLLRAWRVYGALDRREESRQALQKAERLAPDRNGFLESIHHFRILQLKSRAATLEDEIRQEHRGTEDLPELVQHLLDLGECPRALGILAEFRNRLEGSAFDRLAAMAYDRQGRPDRAVEHLQRDGSPIDLARAAERCGAKPLAVAALEEGPLEEGPPWTRKKLEDYYLQLALRDLERGSDKIVGETILEFTHS